MFFGGFYFDRFLLVFEEFFFGVVKDFNYNENCIFFKENELGGYVFFRYLSVVFLRIFVIMVFFI